MKIELTKYKEAYLKESRSHLKVLNLSLLKLEKTPDDVNFMRNISHAIHSLKSLAATMNYNDTMTLCHTIEDLLEAIRNKKVSVDQCSDLLFECFDQLNENIKNSEMNVDEKKSDELIQKIHSMIKNNHSKKSRSRPSESNAITESVEKIKALEVKVEHLDTLMNLAEELLVCKMKFDLIRDQVDNPELTSSVESLGRLITDLQYRVIQIRLMPIEFIFNRFFRMARDIAKQQNKEVDLEIEGGDIELDRLLLDEVSESIAHLIRNAIDHGLEKTEIRKQLGKKERGVITLRATRSKDSAVIEVSDDGAGLNLPAIKALAIKERLLSKDASDDEIINCIFSNLSTNKSVSEVSGRGVGLSIVKEKIESIGGSIHVDSIPGEKTSFYLKIPLTLAIIKMLFIRVSGDVYSIPIDGIERLLTVSQDAFKGLLNHKAIIFEDKDIPVITLSELFGKENTSQPKQHIVIIRKGDDRIGLAVDSLIATQEVIIKPLNRTLKENRFFSGVAMIGSGEIVLIIDVNHLIHSKDNKMLTPV